MGHDGPGSTTESAPIVTPHKTVAVVPIQTFLSMVIDLTVMYARRLSGSTGWPAVTRLTLLAIITSSAMSMAPSR